MTFARGKALHTPIEQLLADIGIPVERCPTCTTSNWEFHGAVDVGIVAVTCRTCGRRYEVVDGCQELAWYHRTLARMMDRHEVGPSVAVWGQMVTAWHERKMMSFSELRPLCVLPGTLDWTDDEAPF